MTSATEMRTGLQPILGEGWRFVFITIDILLTGGLTTHVCVNMIRRPLKAASLVLSARYVFGGL